MRGMSYSGDITNLDESYREHAKKAVLLTLSVLAKKAGYSSPTPACSGNEDLPVALYVASVRLKMS